MMNRGLVLIADDDLELAHIPRVLISANGDAATRVSRCGAATFVSKPVTPEKLLAALKLADS